MKQTKYLYSFFSNNLDYLSYLLNTHLFTASSQPFDKRWVIIPNTTLKYWLKNKLTTLNKQFLSMGVSIISLEEFFKEIFHLFPLNDRSKKLFLTDTLLPYIYQEIRSPHLLEKNDFLMHQDLSKNPAILTYSNISSLISAFKKYYLYNVDENGKLNEQLDLWNKIRKNFYSIKEVFSFIFDFLSKKNFSCSLFFFCPEYFFTDLLYFIDKISSIYNTFTYHLSPCAEFWGDVISDQQISYIQTKFSKFKVNKTALKDWFSLVTDRNPLLANLGQLEKKCFNQIESLDPIFINEYVLPKETHNLAKIQKDILYLSLPSTPLKDASISIHICGNARREIEVLFNNITQLVQKEQTALSDIFIGTFNLSLYENYLSTIFHNIPLNIIGKSNTHSLSLFEKISLIRDLFKNNLCFNSILSLFSYKDFISHMNLDEDDVDFLISWLETHPFFYNKEKNSDWKTSLDTLLDDYPSFNHKSNSNYFELIGKINLWMNYLQEALEHILTTPQNTLSIWFSEITSHLSSLFTISDEEQLILSSLEKTFFDLTNFSKDSPQLFELDFFFDFLIDKITSKKEDIKHPFIKNTIHCGRLKDLALLPKKYFFIIGMHSHPPKAPLFIEEVNQYQIPSEIDIENQLILNAIVTTQKQLTISYISDSQEQKPPIFGVDEIKKYIDEAQIYYHPNKNYSYKYFSKNSSNLYLDTLNEKLSHLYTLSSKSFEINPLQLDFFLQHNIPKEENSNNIEQDNKKEFSKQINIKHLAKSLTNPLYHFLSSKFSYFSSKQQSRYSKPKFFITKNEKATFLNNLLEENTSSSFRKQELFLSAYFSNLAEEEKKDLTAFYKKNLYNQEVKKIVFSNNYLYPEIQENTIYFPPVRLETNKTLLSITGTIHGVLNNSLLVLEELNLGAILKLLPEIALIKKASQKFKDITPIDNIQFLSKSISTEYFKDDYLSTLLDYYFLSQKKPSPFLLDWIPSILNLDEKGLQKEIDKTLKKNTHPLLTAIFSYAPPQAIFILETWGQKAKNLFPFWEDIKK